jgi:hypothetical protein
MAQHSMILQEKETTKGDLGPAYVGTDRLKVLHHYVGEVWLTIVVVHAARPIQVVSSC